MSVVIHNPPMKLKPIDPHWIGHPDCEQDGDAVRYIKEHRAELEVYGEIADDDACYSYDNFALVKAPNGWYLLQTSGCSCPSPRETWRVEIGPATPAEIEEFVRGGHYDGYTLPKEQEVDFVALIASLKEVS